MSYPARAEGLGKYNNSVDLLMKIISDTNIINIVDLLIVLIWEYEIIIEKMSVTTEYTFEKQ